MNKDQIIKTTAAIPAPEANDQAFHLIAPLPPNPEAKRRSFERNTWNPIPIHQLVSPDLLTRESDTIGESGSDASESDGENDDDENEDAEEEEGNDDNNGGGENGSSCCSLQSRFSWLIGGKTEKSLLGRESRITTIVDSLKRVLCKFKDLIHSMSFGSSGMSSTTIFGQLLVLVLSTGTNKKKKKRVVQRFENE